MAFSGNPRPSEMLAWIEAAYGKSQNKTGFQGAHIIAKELWRDLDIQSLLGLGDETNLNCVLAPETTSSGTILRYSTHRGQQLNLYDSVFYDSDPLGECKILYKQRHKAETCSAGSKTGDVWQRDMIDVPTLSFQPS